MKSPIVIVLYFLIMMTAITNAQQKVFGNVWSLEKARQWQEDNNWISGANFNPSTAINQLEMWQEESFDPQTIDRELGYAEGIGFNTMRVYLHSLAYKADPKGFLKRVENYLSIADKHHIKTIFVIFDDVWNPTPKIGKQPEPRPGIHNSGWVQDPGDPASKDESKFPELEIYVKDLINKFSKDHRILMWDLYNEPGNSGKFSASVPLLSKVFQWAREVNPSQPLTVGIWQWSKNYQEVNEIQALNSDIISYHHYGDPEDHLKIINLLKTHGRPLVCTEYMARTRNSRFSNIMPMLKAEGVGAINWGLVSGKSNTIYQWDTPIPFGAEPDEWFHDVFRKDGTPYREDEVKLIKKLNDN